MATVAQLKTIVDQLEVRIEKLEADNVKLLTMLQAAVDECGRLQGRLAAAAAKQGQPKASTSTGGGAKEETFASIKDALAAAKVLATSGKARSVKVTGTTVSYYPVS